MKTSESLDPESLRLKEDQARQKNWKRWGPYLSERQWGTVREDYSPDGSCWDYFTHDHSRSRAYRWGEDGILGWTDRQCRLCFSVTLWNSRDYILKERIFGLTGPEGNNGEDVKESYFYLDSLPTHSYTRGLYKYPQREFPYHKLVEENGKLKRGESEFELLDTKLFDSNEYFDVFVEYAKADDNDTLINITVLNRSSEPAPVHILPTLWFRNTWSWGRTGESYTERPELRLLNANTIAAYHPSLGDFKLSIDPQSVPNGLESLFTENETNTQRLFNAPSRTPYVKDAFHEYLVHNRKEVVNPAKIGTKACFHGNMLVPAKGEVTLRLRLHQDTKELFGVAFDKILRERRRETDQFYAAKTPPNATPAEAQVMRQAYSGLLWNKQFYYYSVKEWLEGDPAQPMPDPKRLNGRNSDWGHLYNRDIISMPDKWEYPWYAAWDLAFHAVAFANIDPDFAKRQLVLLMREWYMHPNGKMPAYEFGFDDVNPPVHAWACWRVYKMSGPRGKRDRNFLSRTFQKLLVNFTWWVNRKDLHGENLFSGGFLGLDNIGVFDRGAPLPTGGHLEQADATAWMAFYCGTMLSMALELASEDQGFGDMASKFFEHFVAIADSINHLGGKGLWDADDGFYYDELNSEGKEIPLRIRSLVGIIPILAVEVLEDSQIDKLSGFKKRLNWFLKERKDLERTISYMEKDGLAGHRLLAVPSRERLASVLKYVFDEAEFLSPYGIRSLSKVHEKNPYIFKLDDQEYRVDYAPGESNTPLFGGNSNWRGPVWLPINYLLIEALERYHHFYGDSFQIEYPTGSGRKVNLAFVAADLSKRLSLLFLPDKNGGRPCHANDRRFAEDPYWKDLILFNEYFHAETGKGLGASHQTGWTALVSRCLQKWIARR
jgi:hypothetical protein